MFYVHQFLLLINPVVLLAAVRLTPLMRLHNKRFQVFRLRRTAGQNSGRFGQWIKLMNVEHRTSNIEYRIKEFYRFLSPSLNPSRQGREVNLLPLDGGGWVGVN